MTEHEATLKFEELAGGPARARELSRLYDRATTTASGNAFTLRATPTAEELFRRWAERDGHDLVAIEHYLAHVA